VLPETAGEPQGELLTLRVKDSGKSKGRVVMARIQDEMLPGAKAG
jgi:hypothetical protein